MKITPRAFDCPDCEQKAGTACTVRGDFHVRRSNLANVTIAALRAKEGKT